jgi:hypothetical protein
MIEDSDSDITGPLVVTELLQYIQYFGHSKNVSNLNLTSLNEVIGIDDSGNPVSWKKGRRFNSLSFVEYGKGYLIKSSNVNYELFSENEMIPSKFTLEGNKIYIARYLGSEDLILANSDLTDFVEEIVYLENGVFYSWSPFQQNNGLSILKYGKTYQIKTFDFDGSFNLWDDKNSPPYLGANITSEPPEIVEKTSGSVVLSILTSGMVGPTYVWQKKESGGTFSTVSNSSKYSGATTSQITINDIDYSDHDDRYRCIVSDSKNTLFSRETTLLTSNFSIILQPKGTTIQDAGLINQFLTTSDYLKVIVSGGSGSYTYQWQYSAVDSQGVATWTNMPIDLVSGDSYTSSSIARITTLRPGGNSPVYGSTSGQEKYGQKTFRCRISDGQSTIYSNSVTINSIPFSVNILTQPNSVLISNNIVIYVEYDTPVPVVWRYEETDGSEGYVSSFEATFQYSTITVSNITKYRNTLTVLNLDHSKVGRKYYALVGSIEGGVKTSSKATLLGNPPTITSQPNSKIVDYYGNTSLAISWANPVTSVAWQYSSNLDDPNWTSVPNPPLPGTGSINSGAQSSTLSLNGISETNSGYYRVVLNYSMGSVTSSIARISVLDPYINISGPLDITVSAGNTAIFTPVYKSSNDSRLTYQWYFKLVGSDWAIVGPPAGVASSFSVNTSDTSKNGRKYKVVAKLGSLEVTSREATLTVLASTVATPTPTRTPTPTPTPTPPARCINSLPLYASIFPELVTPVKDSTGILELNNRCSNPKFSSFMNDYKGINERVFCVNRKANKMYVHYDNGTGNGRGVEVVDLSTRKIIGSVLNSTGGKLGANSLYQSIMVDPDKNVLYLANYISSNLDIVDCSTDTLIKSIDWRTGGMVIGARYLAVNRQSNKTYVASLAEVCVVDNNTYTVLKKIYLPNKETYVRGPICDICVDTKKNIIYVCLSAPRKNNLEVNKEIIAIDGNTDTILGTFYSFNSTNSNNGYEPVKMVVNPLTNKIYVRTFELSHNTSNGQAPSANNPISVSDVRKVYYGRDTITVLNQNSRGDLGTFNKIIPINGRIKLTNGQTVSQPGYDQLSEFGKNGGLKYYASKALEIDINSNTVYAGVYTPWFSPTQGVVSPGQLGVYAVPIDGNGGYPSIIVDGVARGYALCEGSCTPSRLVFEMHNVQPPYSPMVATPTPTPTPTLTGVVVTPIGPTPTRTPTRTPTSTPVSTPIPPVENVTRMFVENNEKMNLKINSTFLNSVDHYAILVIHNTSDPKNVVTIVPLNNGHSVIGSTEEEYYKTIDRKPGVFHDIIFPRNIGTLKYYPAGVFDNYEINQLQITKDCDISVWISSNPFVIVGSEVFPSLETAGQYLSTTSLNSPLSLYSKWNEIDNDSRCYEDLGTDFCLWPKGHSRSRGSWPRGYSVWGDGGYAFTGATLLSTSIELPLKTVGDRDIEILEKDKLNPYISSWPPAVTGSATMGETLKNFTKVHSVDIRIRPAREQINTISNSPDNWYFFGCYGEGASIPNGVTLAASRFIPTSILLLSQNEGDSWEAISLPYPLQCLGLVYWKQKFWLFHMHNSSYLTAMYSIDGKSWQQSGWNFGKALYSSTTAQRDLPHGRPLGYSSPVGKPSDDGHGSITGYGGLTVSVCGGILYVATISSGDIGSSEFNTANNYKIFRIHTDTGAISDQYKCIICPSFISVVSKASNGLLVSGNMYSIDNGNNWSVISTETDPHKSIGRPNLYYIKITPPTQVAATPWDVMVNSPSGGWRGVWRRSDPSTYSSALVNAIEQDGEGDKVLRIEAAAKAFLSSSLPINDITIDPGNFSSFIGPQIGNYSYGMTWDNQKKNYYIIRMDYTGKYELLCPLNSYFSGFAYPYFGAPRLAGRDWTYGTKWSYDPIYGGGPYPGPGLGSGFKTSGTRMVAYRYGPTNTLPQRFFNGTESPPGMGEAIFTKNKIIVLYRTMDCFGDVPPYTSYCASQSYGRYYDAYTTVTEPKLPADPGDRPWQPR